MPLGHVTAHRPCDLDLVDRLARIHLAALRTGGSIVLRHPSSALRDLLVLAGLDDLLAGSSGRGAREQGEQAAGRVTDEFTGRPSSGV